MVNDPNKTTEKIQDVLKDIRKLENNRDKMEELVEVLESEEDLDLFHGEKYRVFCEAYIIRTVRSPSPTGFPRNVSSDASKNIIKIANQMQNCITGVLIAIKRSPSVKSLATSSLAFSNFCVSNSSRTNDFTTRIPLMSSRIERFI